MQAQLLSSLYSSQGAGVYPSYTPDLTRVAPADALPGPLPFSELLAPAVTAQSNSIQVWLWYTVVTSLLSRSLTIRDSSEETGT